MTSTRHLSEILLIQIVATYLVILGHSYPFITPVPLWLQQAQVFIYCFHMPLFVWVSGYLLVYSQQSLRNSPKTFIKKRALKLLTPYLILSLVALIPKFLLQSYLNDSVVLDPLSLVRTFLCPRENVWGHFWFLPMIFILGIVGLLIDKLLHKLSLSVIGWSAITSGAFIVYSVFFHRHISSWLSLDDLIAFGWLFALGALCAHLSILNKIRSTKTPRSALAAFAAAIAIFIYAPTGIIYPVITALIALLMIYALSALSIAVSSKINLDKSAVYAQTFTIFILSWPCQAVANVVTERLLQMPYYAIMTIQFVTGLIVPMILIWFINRIEKKFGIRWISFCLGK